MRVPASPGKGGGDGGGPGARPREAGHFIPAAFATSSA